MLPENENEAINIDLELLKSEEEEIRKKYMFIVNGKVKASEELLSDVKADVVKLMNEVKAEISQILSNQNNILYS